MKFVKFVKFVKFEISLFHIQNVRLSKSLRANVAKV